MTVTPRPAGGPQTTEPLPRRPRTLDAAARAAARAVAADAGPPPDPVLGVRQHCQRSPRGGGVTSESVPAAA